jgi:transcriptional regulator with XRE-family HTH domain
LARQSNTRLRVCVAQARTTQIGNNEPVRYANDPEIEEQIGAFGANMRATRRRAGMTQTDLAAIDGLDRAAISLTEKGKRSPDMRTLLRIAEGLDVTAAELVSDIGPYSRNVNGPVPKELPSFADDPYGSSHRKARGKQTTPFSRNLYAARRRAGISQQALGAHADVDAAAISLYERGQREPNLRTVLKLARTLKISPVELLRDVR